MNSKLQKYCDSLVDYKNSLSEAFLLDGGSANLVAAALLTSAGKTVSTQKLKECKAILKEAESIFSEYRGNAMEILVAYMALSTDPAEYLERVKGIYKSLKKFFESANDMMAALSIADRTVVGDEQQAVDKMNQIKSILHDEYKWSVPDDLIPYVALMATSGKGVEEVCKDAAECFDNLDIKHLSKSEKRQLACILTLGKGSVEDRCREIREQAEAMKLDGILAKTANKIVLGALPLVSSESADADNEKIAREISEIDDYLKSQKGFNWLNVDSDIRKSVSALLYALASVEKEDFEINVFIDAAIQEIMKVQLIALTAVVVAASS